MSAMAIAGAFALGLSACSTPDPETNGPDPETNAEEPGAAGELVIWHMEGVPSRVAAFNDLAERYNATGPAYEVVFEVQDWDQIYTKIAAAAQSGQQPDVLFVIPDFATYVRGLGVGQPVTDVVEALDDTYGLLDAASAPYLDEDYWAVPLYGMVQVLWYRADLLAEAGVEPPETWSDLLAAAQALTVDGRSGIALPAGKNLATDQVIFSLMTTAGAANFFTDDGQVAIDTPETVAAFELYRELLEFSPVDSGNYAWGEPQAAFNSGSAAMAIEKGQYLSPFVEESGATPADLGCMPIPVKDQSGQSGSIYYSNGAMVLSDDEARVSAAGDFLSWLLEPENYGDFLNAEPGLFLPVTSGGAELETWRSNDVLSTYPECVDVMLEQSETGTLFGFADGQYIDSIGQISGQNFLAQAIQEMYVNDMSAEDAVAWMQAQMQKAID